jgi:hypothetical protein
MPISCAKSRYEVDGYIRCVRTFAPIIKRKSIAAIAASESMAIWINTIAPYAWPRSYSTRESEKTDVVCAPSPRKLGPGTVVPVWMWIMRLIVERPITSLTNKVLINSGSSGFGDRVHGCGVEKLIGFISCS